MAREYGEAEASAVAMSYAAELREMRAKAASTEKELSRYRRMLEADTALHEALAATSVLTALRDCIAEMLGLNVKIVDLKVRHDVRDPSATLDSATRPLVALSAQQNEPVEHLREDQAVLTVMAVQREATVLGAILVEGRIALEAEPALDRGARILGIHLATRERERSDFERRRSELISQVLAPAPTGLARTTIDRLRDYGVAESQPFRILVAEGNEASRRDFEHRLELDFGAGLLRTKVGEQMVAFVPEHAFARIREQLEAQGSRLHGKLLVGHSPKLHMLDIVPEEYALVQRLLQAAQAQSAPSQSALVSLEGYGAIGAFLTKVTIEPTKRAIQDTLGPLLEYDRLHRADLAETAYEYFDLGRSVSKVATRMLIHENTVRQRLERVASLLGVGWAHGQAGLDHHILLAANRLIG